METTKDISSLDIMFNRLYGDETAVDKTAVITGEDKAIEILEKIQGTLVFAMQVSFMSCGAEESGGMVAGKAYENAIEIIEKELNILRAGNVKS